MKNEDEEREFRANHSSLDYFDTKEFKRASFPKLKTLGNKKDVPYQSLAKIYLARQISLERGPLRITPRKRGRKVNAHGDRDAHR